MSSNTWRTTSRFLPLSLPGLGSSIWSVRNIDLMLYDSHKDWNLQHMQTLAGPDAEIHFTNLSKSSSSSLSAEFSSTSEKFSNSQCHTDGVLDLMKTHGKSLDRICLLDPNHFHQKTATGHLTGSYSVSVRFFLLHTGFSIFLCVILFMRSFHLHRAF